MKCRIAVLSDLHAHQKARPPKDGGGREPLVSYLPAHPEPSDPKPFADLKRLITEEGLTADIVVCPGDICDKGDVIGFNYAWDQLQNVKTALNANHLIATCGNHDLDSRYASTGARDDDPDPKGNLLQASPVFPFGDTMNTNHFWARNFVLLRPLPRVRILVLNTSAYHGGKEGELEFGRVSLRTIEAIQKNLQTDVGAADLNVLVCHHHLQPLLVPPGLALDLQHVRKGADLINALTRATHSPWLVIHGHRHLPHVSHSLSPPVITMGAASFARVGDYFANQFHLLEVEADLAAAQMPIRGYIRTWNWSRSNRWAVYLDPSKGLPPVCGFGFDGNVRALPDRIAAALHGQAFMGWDQLTTAIPELKFLSPDQWETFTTQLAQSGLAIHQIDGVPNQVGHRRV